MKSWVSLPHSHLSLSIHPFLASDLNYSDLNAFYLSSYTNFAHFLKPYILFFSYTVSLRNFFPLRPTSSSIISLVCNFISFLNILYQLLTETFIFSSLTALVVCFANYSHAISLLRMPADWQNASGSEVRRLRGGGKNEAKWSAEGEQSKVRTVLATNRYPRENRGSRGIPDRNARVISLDRGGRNSWQK